MAVTRYKILSQEIDGVESEFPQEIPLDADKVYFNAEDFTSDNVKDGIFEAKGRAETLFQYPRYVIPLVLNSTVSNGTWLSVSNLLPDVAIVIPIKSQIKEIAWANANTGCSFTFQIHRNTRTNLQETLSVTLGQYGVLLPTQTIIFNQGDTIEILYTKTGGSTLLDLSANLFFQAVE